jgi:hypothetical protein
LPRNWVEAVVDIGQERPKFTGRSEILTRPHFAKPRNSAVLAHFQTKLFGTILAGIPSDPRSSKGKGETMRVRLRVICLVGLSVLLPTLGWSQTATTGSTASPPPASPPPAAQKSTVPTKYSGGPGHQMGKGGEDIGKGVAKGTGDLAKGTAGSVASLAHGNFGGAGTSLGRGAFGMGKDVTVGSAKGFTKIGKGIRGEFRKHGHKSRRETVAP